MRNVLCLAVALASLSTICSAQTITETFGSGANAFTMDFVEIGNPNNAPDTTGSPIPAGSVAYTYNIGKYEVSGEQIDKANSAGNLGITMGGYRNDGSGANKPAKEISWNEAATFVNWLNTSKGYQAAYKFVGGTFQLWSSTDAGYNASNMFRNSLAKYVITSTDEWHKAAYGKADGSWSKYPNGLDTVPTAVAGGTAANTAVYDQSRYSIPADINNAGGLSSYGTMAQGGNVWEWMETAYDGINDNENIYYIPNVGMPLGDARRQIRGVAWWLDYDEMGNSYAYMRASNVPEGFELTYEKNNIGFRVAMIPEPSSLSLLALGGLVVALRRRR